MEDRKIYLEQYRKVLKEKSKTVCKCGITYNTYNSKTHISRHNNSRTHLKYLFDNNVISIEYYIPVMNIVELREKAKEYDIDNYLYFDKEYLKDILLTHIYINKNKLKNNVLDLDELD